MPVRWAEPRVKSPEIIERMRHAGRVAAEVLRLAGEMVRPGITTDEIDVYVHDLCIERGAYPSPLNYNRYPKSVCTSVNEVICHGIPDSRVLLDGDIVNLDVTTYIGGVHGDTNATFLVGDVDGTAATSCGSPRSACGTASRPCAPGGPCPTSAGRSRTTPRPTTTAWCGRSSATASASSSTPTCRSCTTTTSGPATIMRPGMTFTIEPMITLGSWRHVLWPDGWTAVTSDGKRTAQFEHTLLVTDDGVDVLTGGDGAASPHAPWA